TGWPRAIIAPSTTRTSGRAIRPTSSASRASSTSTACDRMKITGIEAFVVDAGWRPWQFVAVRTDEGLTGYGECSDGRNPYGVVGTVRDFAAILVARAPRPAGMR